MSISLPLKSMTIEEERPLIPPEWHGNVLETLEASIERGEETFEDWETAKRRIRDTLS